MAHESTFEITFGGATLVSTGDLVETEPRLSRSPAAPQPSLRIRASEARYFGGRGLSHSLGWTIRREFTTVAEARSYQWSRPAELPEGRQTLTIVDSGRTATLADAHLTGFELEHRRPCVVIETVAVLGGAYSVSGSTTEPPWPGTPGEPWELPTDGADPAAGFLLLESGGSLLLEWTAAPLRLDHN